MRSSRLLSRPGLPEGLTLESVNCICQVSTYLAHPAHTLKLAHTLVKLSRQQEMWVEWDWGLPEGWGWGGGSGFRAG